MKIELKNSLPIQIDEKTPARSISRREAGKRLLAGMAMGTTVPWITSGHPIWKHFENAELLERAERATGDDKPAFLNQEQYLSLVAASETILPGSTKAGVAKFVDLLLSVDSPRNQKEFADSLGQIDTESAKRFGKGITQLTVGQRNELFAAISASDDTKTAGDANHKAFLHLREWIAGSYYSSEIGMRELGWTPDRVFAEFPGCSHTDANH